MLMQSEVIRRSSASREAIEKLGIEATTEEVQRRSEGRRRRTCSGKWVRNWIERVQPMVQLLWVEPQPVVTWTANWHLWQAPQPPSKELPRLPSHSEVPEDDRHVRLPTDLPFSREANAARTDKESAQRGQGAVAVTITPVKLAIPQFQGAI